MSLNIDPSLWRLRTGGGIPYKHLSQTGNADEEGGKASEQILIEADRLDDFIVESFPVPYALGDTIFLPQRRTLPGVPQLYTRDIKWEGFTDPTIDPFGADSSAPGRTYERFLRLTIEYSTLQPQQGGQDPDPSDPLTFLEISADVGGEFLSATARGATWQDDGSEVKIDVPATVTQPTTEWTARWSQVPYEFLTGTLMGRMRNKLGKVNDGPMSLFFNAAAETVM